jgi:hypothetical protein
VDFARLFRLALAASLTISALLFFLWSWHWPLVGDASLIHYIAFLIERGWAPYRDLGDMNMPGSFLIELGAMHLFGFGDLAWRIFDFTLLAAAAASFLVITRRAELDASASRLAALFAASLFIVLHGRDGLAEGGQRDLTMAVLLLAATAFLFLAVRKSAPSKGVSLTAAAFGLLSGIALTIKPTTLPLTFLQLLLAAYTLRQFLSAYAARESESPTRIVLLRYVAPAALAYAIAPAIALTFLVREHALPAFLAGFHGIIPYYASLGHRPLGYLLLHSISPLLPLVLLWLAALALDGALRNSPLNWLRDWERAALLAGVLFGIINCIVQARGLPYYRYPVLAFLLPLIALDLTRALEVPWTATLRSRATHVVVIAALAFSGFFLAPQSTILIHRYRWWETDFITTLQQNLTTLGGPALSGRIQCIDSISGCGNVLYRMRLEPSTGVLSDFLLFGPPPGSADVPIIRDTRTQFTSALASNPPKVIVVTSHLHIDGPDNYLKLDRWPAFAAYLATNYTLQTEWSPTRTARWWSREETPAGYRIYILRAPHP